MSDDLREQLAALAHEQWSGWMRYFLAQCERPHGEFAIPYEYLIALRRLINTPYTELSEQDKDKDREEADKVLAILGVYDGGDDEV